MAGRHGDALKIRVGAPALEGKANQALLEFIAKMLGVPKRAVSVVKGEASRQKLVRVAEAGVDPGRLYPQQS